MDMFEAFTENVAKQALFAELESKLAKLATLGSANAIALYFQAEQIRGYRHSSFNCPVAKWLQAQGLEVGVGTTSSCGLPLPRPVIEFIHKFDNNFYNELDVLKLPATNLLYNV